MRSNDPDGGVNTLAIAITFLGVALAGALMLRDSMAGYTGMAMRGDPGPFFLPQLCLAVIPGAGVILFGRALWDIPGRGFTLTYRPVEIARRWAISAAMTLSLLLMPFGMSILGTALAVAVFAVIWIFLLLWSARGLRWRNAGEALFYGALAAVTIHVIFIRLLHLPLPG